MATRSFSWLSLTLAGDPSVVARCYSTAEKVRAALCMSLNRAKSQHMD